MYTTEQQYELGELLDEANRIRENFPEIASGTPFNQRTVYYYVQEDLLPRRSGRGPGTLYPGNFLYRLLLIRRLQQIRGVSLGHIRRLMRRFSDEQIYRLAMGLEPIRTEEIKNEEEFSAKVSADNQDVLLLSPDDSIRPLRERSDSYQDIASLKRPSSPPLAKSNMSTDTLRNEFSMTSPNSSQHSYPVGDKAWLVVNKTVSSRQARQLEHIAKLVKEILDDEE